MKHTIAALFAAILFGGCSNNTEPLTGQGDIKMNLVDSPAGYDEVNIVVIRVDVHQAGADSGSGWITVRSDSATYDLLKLMNDASAVLGSNKLSVGQYTQIRLILGQGNNVVVNGTTYPLVVSSGFETGVKLNHQFRIGEGALYELTLDFDAARSIRQVGNQYSLTPVIRIQAHVTSGNIAGKVLPVAANASVWTTIGSDTVTSWPDTSGAFKLVALPEGVYAVRFSPANTAYRDTTISGVAVTKQQTTNMGTITLSTQ